MDYNEKWERKPAAKYYNSCRELPILKLWLPNFRWSFYFILLFVPSLLFRRILMMSRMTLSSASKFWQPNFKEQSFLMIDFEANDKI